MQREAGVPRGEQRVDRHRLGVLEEPRPGHLHREVRQRGRAERAADQLCQHLLSNADREFHRLGALHEFEVLLRGGLVLGRVDQPDHDLQHGGLQVDADAVGEGQQGGVERAQRGLHGGQSGGASDGGEGAEVGDEALGEMDDHAADGGQTDVVLAGGVPRAPLLHRRGENLQQFYASPHLTDPTSITAGRAGRAGRAGSAGALAVHGRQRLVRQLAEHLHRQQARRLGRFLRAAAQHGKVGRVVLRLVQRPA